MAKKKASLSTKEVAWSGDKPTKYQAQLEYVISEDRTIRLLSSPKATMEAAMDDLCEEVMNWEEAMSAFKEAIR